MTVTAHRPPTPSPDVARRLLRAKDFIDGHYDEHLLVAAVAQIASCNS